jgi:hypothetical protein
MGFMLSASPTAAVEEVPMLQQAKIAEVEVVGVRQVVEEEEVVVGVKVVT